jgi:perosamine synthetase
MTSDLKRPEFSLPLANSADYPPVQFSATPSTCPHTVTAPVERIRPEGAEGVIYCHRARYALALAAHALLPTRARVLLPSYHCPAMVEPFLWAGCRVDFYHMNPDLSPEPESFKRLLAEADAVLLTRYFGFDSGIEESVAIARCSGVLVIEDLAHAAYSRKLSGDVAVTSLTKFYPCTQGAELIVRKAEHHGAALTAKGSLENHKVVWPIKHAGRRVLRKLGLASTSPGFRYFDPLQVHRPESQRPNSTNQIAEEEIIGIRRQHFFQLQALVGELDPRGILPGEPPRDFAPYVFPLVIPRASIFHELRNAGLPIQRWEELIQTGCKVSNDYRHRLVQLPIHQAVTPAQFHHMLETVRRSLTKDDRITSSGR